MFNVAEYRILHSGDVEINPGYENELSDASKQPQNLKFPRRVCEKSVRNNQKGILCDNRNMWFHCQCIGINAIEYQALALSDDEWILLSLRFALLFRFFLRNRNNKRNNTKV